MKPVVLVVSAAVAALTTSGVSAQSWPYDCQCEEFCATKCAIDPVVPANVTLYRMTPFGVYDLTDKNTGDAAGDAGFLLSKRNQAAECRLTPTLPQCQDLVNFQGDTEDSTDLILEMHVELDGKFGPYLECNDVNTSDPLGDWACKYDGYAPGGSSSPPQCTKSNFTPYDSRCFNSDPRVPALKPIRQENVKDLGACCTLANKTKAKYWQMDTDANECSLWKVYPGGLSTCNKSNILGFKTTPQVGQCMCERIFETVGIQRTSAEDGVWYSHPRAGECKNGHYVGDGSGCSYRHIKTVSAINASCMYARIDRLVEAQAPACFVKCEQPQNKTSNCYDQCFMGLQYEIEPEELEKTWKEAMSLGPQGCPQVHIKSSLYVPEYPELHEL